MTDCRATSAAAVLLALAGCTTAAPSVESSLAPTITASPLGEPSTPAPSSDPRVLTVSARANIFGAGHDTPPAGGGVGGTDGRGVLPPVWQLTPDATVVTFPSVTGELTPIDDYYPPFGAGGDPRGATDIQSSGGISGIVHGSSGLFLAGVFLTDAQPADPAPERLDFTGADDFGELAPLLAQTFFIGDGAGRSYRVPAGATRLFLGFADGYNGSFYQGMPGYYNNNHGELLVRVEVD